MFGTDSIHQRPDHTDLSRKAAERHAVLAALAERRASERRSTAARRSAAATRRVSVAALE